MGVPSVRKWLTSSLPLEASSEPLLNNTITNHEVNPDKMYNITQASHHTTHLTNMIFEVTPSSWLRTA